MPNIVLLHVFHFIHAFVYYNFKTCTKNCQHCPGFPSHFRLMVAQFACKHQAHFSRIKNPFVSSGGGALGHPLEYIQLNTADGLPQRCKYCNLKFIRKKHH